MSEMIRANYEMTKEEAELVNGILRRSLSDSRFYLLKMRDEKGWKALGYESFDAFGEKEHGIAKSHLYRLADAAEVQLSLNSPLGEKIPETHLRPLAKVDDVALRRAIWEEVNAEHEKVTAARIQEAVDAAMIRANEDKILALEAQLQEAQGVVNPDFAALAKEIDKLKRANAKLRAANKALEAAGSDGNAQASVYADELEKTRAELAKAQAEIEAGGKGLTVAPAKVVMREDPEKDRLLKEQQTRIAALEKARSEAENRAKYNAALLEKADAQLIDKTTRLAKLEAPDAYLSAYTAGVVDDFNRRTRGAIGAVQRSGVAPAPEMIHQIETARSLLDELLDLCRDRGAHDAGTTLPALDVLN